MKNISISVDLNLDELAILLGMLEQNLESDQIGVPKEHTRDVESLYKKFVKIAEKIEAKYLS